MEGGRMTRLCASLFGVLAAVLVGSPNEGHAASPAAVDDAFEIFDADKDGFVSQREARDGVPKITMALLDTGGDGRVSLAEWRVSERFPGADKMFEYRDENGDGFLTIAELRLRDKQWQFFEKRFRWADRNGDGLLDLAEAASAVSYPSM